MDTHQPSQPLRTIVGLLVGLLFSGGLLAVYLKLAGATANYGLRLPDRDTLASWWREAVARVEVVK